MGRTSATSAIEADTSLATRAPTWSARRCLLDLTPAPPLLPHCGPWRVAVGEVAPLAARPGEEQEGVHDLAPVIPGRAAPPVLRVEDVLDERPLGVRQLYEAARGCSLPPARDRFSGTEGLLRAGSFVHRA